eukprot:3953646-Lingulodinium_polyedra.AAC.1
MALAEEAKARAWQEGQCSMWSLSLPHILQCCWPWKREEQQAAKAQHLSRAFLAGATIKRADRA